MIVVIQPRDGETRGLAEYIGLAPREAWWLRLFTNHRVPTRADTAADYVEPEPRTGYFPVVLAPSDFQIWPASPERPTAIALSRPHRFRFSSGQFRLHGYYLTGLETGTLRHVGTWDEPIVIRPGQEIDVIPEVVLTSVLIRDVPAWRSTAASAAGPV